MKTIEEKAKAYDEALERAKQIRNGNPSSGTAIVVCEQIFPELKESEDEKDNISILLCMIDSMDSISLPSGTLRISGEKRRELKEFIKRPSWKPTQEQMAVLLRTEGLMRATYYKENAKILAELIEDLKKLCQ